TCAPAPVRSSGSGRSTDAMTCSFGERSPPLLRRVSAWPRRGVRPSARSPAVGEAPGVLGVVVAVVVVDGLLDPLGSERVVVGVVATARARTVTAQHRQRRGEVVGLHEHVAGLRPLRGTDDLA